MMLLDVSEIPVPLKVVFDLAEELKVNSERVAVTQSLTLDKSKPQVGLKGSNGLFGSQEWWDSIIQGRMPVLRYSGVIEEAFVAGQDEGEINNTIALKLKDGSTQLVGIYTNDKADVKCFQPNHYAAIVYALDELKQQPARDGRTNYSKVALQMAVSLVPAR